MSRPAGHPARRAVALWLSIPCTVFGQPQPDLADPWYDLRLCGTGERAGAVATGLSFTTTFGLDDLAGADTVIVPSVPDPCVEEGAPLPEGLVPALRRAYDAGARMVSLCTGAFALAEAGLLDGRRATAHWMHTAQLAERYPKVEVDDSVLYVDDGDVLTSAGLTAGLDWARAHLDRPLTVEDLARRAAMSPRTFYRRLQAATGTTPLRWLLNQRLARAQSLLESTDLSVEKIGERSGLGTANNLRHHFLRQIGVSPSDYRRAFPAATRD